MLRGYDLVTLAVALPVLLWASTGVRRTTWPGRLTAAAVLAYLGYTYAYHLLGNGFTDLLLLHLAVIVGSITALTRMLGTLSRIGSGATRSPTACSSPRAARGAATTLGVLAAALGGMWVSVCLMYAVTGNLPEGSLLVETDQVVQLGIVLDLAVLVPLYGTAATLLWRGRWWGVVLGAIALVAGLLHQVSYLVALVFQDLAGVPGAVPFDPFEPVIVGLYVAGAVLLFRGLGRSGRHSVLLAPAGRRADDHRARLPGPRQDDGDHHHAVRPVGPELVQVLGPPVRPRADRCTPCTDTFQRKLPAGRGER
jgi:hypothetical protein